MKPERWVQVESLYHEIVDLDPSEREARLSGIFDLDLRNEVLSLIQAGALSQSVVACVNEQRGQLLAYEAPTSPMLDAPSTSRSFKPGDLLASRYKIVEFLGQGGMGEVYEAEDRDLGEKIAIKVIRPEAALDKAWVERFRREVQLARRVTHANVCRVFDLERHQRQETEIFFLTMELVRGETLTARLKRTGRLSIPEALPIALQLCSALHAAHQAGILHRDFKCGNVMLVGSGERIRAVVTDFGTARFLDSPHQATHSATQPSAILGTPAYMSPEQLQGKELTPASDIYSLGLVLYEMVTGVRPFLHDSQWAEAMARLNDDPEPPVKTVPNLSRNWNFTILRCLQRTPAKRFPSALEVAESLQATGPSHWLHRRRWVLAIAAVVVLAAAAAFAFRARLFSPSLPSNRRIAVMPFNVAGNDPAEKAMADELAESLTANLAHLPASDGNIWVVPWKSVQQRPSSDEKHAGGALGVNLLLTGELIKLNDGLRLRVGLLDANTLKELRSGVVQVSSQKIVALEDSLLAQACAMLQLEPPQGMLHHLPVDETTEPGAYAFYAQGRGYMQRRETTDMDRAISLFQKAIERDPKFALAYADMALAYGWKFGNTHEPSWLVLARQACFQALSLDDKLASAHVCLGRIQRDTNNLEQAARELERALKLDPANEDVRILLSDTYDQLGKTLEAEAILMDRLTHNKADWVAYDALGVFYYDHARWTQAEQLFQTVAVLAPDNPMAFDQLGGLYLTLRKDKEAEDVLLRSIAIKPTPTAYSNLSIALQRQKRFDDSAAMLEQARTMTPGDHKIWFNLGHIYGLLKDQRKSAQAYEKAAEIAEKGLVLSPGNGELLESLAKYYAFLGKKDKALLTLAQVRGPVATTPDTLYDSALVYQLVGKPELALKAIHSALEAGVKLGRIENTAEFASLRADKRYLDIVKDYAAPTTH